MRRDRSLCDVIDSEIEYVLETGVLGEIDVYCVRDGIGIAVEVKTHDAPTHRQKAEYQLRKDYLFLVEQYKITEYVGFYAYTASSRRGYNVERVY